jgi:hypothetical protein
VEGRGELEGREGDLEGLLALNSVGVSISHLMEMISGLGLGFHVKLACVVLSCSKVENTITVLARKVVLKLGFWVKYTFSLA